MKRRSAARLSPTPNNFILAKPDARGVNDDNIIKRRQLQLLSASAHPIAMGAVAIFHPLSQPASNHSLPVASLCRLERTISTPETDLSRVGGTEVKKIHFAEHLDMSDFHTLHKQNCRDLRSSTRLCPSPTFRFPFVRLQLQLGNSQRARE